jgi:hypothetical protein
MKKVKFIIEVSEEYIRQNADAEVIQKKAAEDKSGFIKAMFDMIAFSSIEKEMDKDNTEFTINRDELGEKTQELFDKTIGQVCMMATMGKDEKKNDDEKPADAQPEAKAEEETDSKDQPASED